MKETTALVVIRVVREVSGREWEIKYSSIEKVGAENERIYGVCLQKVDPESEEVVEEFSEFLTDNRDRNSFILNKLAENLVTPASSIDVVDMVYDMY